MKEMIMSNAAIANEEVAAAIAEVCEENERIFVDGNDCICLYEDEYGASEEEFDDEDLPDGFAPDFDEPFYVLFEEEEEYGSKQDKIA